MNSGIKQTIKRFVSSNAFIYLLFLLAVFLLITQSKDKHGQPYFFAQTNQQDQSTQSAARTTANQQALQGKNSRGQQYLSVSSGSHPVQARSTTRLDDALEQAWSTEHLQGKAPEESEPVSEQPERERIKPAVLEPRAEPYALMADTGIVNVRFSVRLTGDAATNTQVHLRQIGTEAGIAMNDAGMDGDLIAGDSIQGANLRVDTSRLQPDTCLSYIAVLRDGEDESSSSPLNLCVSNLPIRVADSNTENPIVFSDGAKAVADEVLITAKPGTTTAEMQQIAGSINATIVGSIPPLNLYQLKLPTAATEAQLTALVEQLNARPEVKGASVNAIGQTAAAPNDPEYVNQHGLQRVRAQDVWDTGATGAGVIVTVLDSGLDRTHPDFGTVGNCQLTENDCGGTNTDAIGHGTQVAGVIGAKTNNGTGVAGVAYGSKIHSIQVSPTSAITFAQMNQGFADAASYGLASIINASFSGGPWSGVGYTVAVATLCTAVNSAVSSGSGIIAVIAAGNNGANNWYYPARCNEHASVSTGNRARVIAVGNSASTNTASCGSVLIDQRCVAAAPSNPNLLGSNYGSWVEITAPGSDIRMTSSGGGYISNTGTSFSSPIVAGAAAILKSCGVPLGQIESTLRTSANVTVPFPDGSSAPRLDIYRALLSVNKAPTAMRITNSSLADKLNTSLGVAVGRLVVTDQNKCDKFTFTIIGGADAALFSIAGTKGNVLKLKAGILNYAIKPSYAVTVRVKDFGGKVFDKPFTINVIPAL